MVRMWHSLLPVEAPFETSMRRRSHWEVLPRVSQESERRLTRTFSLPTYAILMDIRLVAVCHQKE